MLIVQVDIIHAEPRERCGALFLDKVGITPGTGRRRAKFGREEDFAPFSSAFEPGKES